MRVLVWGLGYVGTVTAACLAEMGHDVVGVDPSLPKVEAVNSGRSAIKEPGLSELVARAVAAGRLSAVPEGVGRVADAEISLVCVGTPSAADGGPVLDYLRRVAEDIGRGMRDHRRHHVVIVRSTVFPGTTRRTVAPLLEQHSGRVAGRDFGLVFNPEFLRETTAVRDFHDAPYTVIGELDERSGSDAAGLFRTLSAPVHRVALEEAELLKLANNSFHALKVGFANEIGRLGSALQLDAAAVMKMVCADTKLNISPAYLRPGFAFGGSCLPKDLRSLVHHGERMGVQLPILRGILQSNREQIEAARVAITELHVRQIAVLGLGFKAGTDDLRESPVIALIRDLWQDGLDIRVHDPDIRLEEMLGSNREYLQRQLPQIRDILRERIEDCLAGCEAVVVTQRRPEFEEAVARLGAGIRRVDLSGQGGAASPQTVGTREA